METPHAYISHFWLALLLCLNAEYFCSRSKNSFNYAVSVNSLLAHSVCLTDSNNFTAVSSTHYFLCFCFYNSLPQVFLGVIKHAFNICDNKSCSTTLRNTCISILYRVFQELGSIIRDLIPELILSQKHHIHMGPTHNGSGVMSF